MLARSRTRSRSSSGVERGARHLGEHERVAGRRAMAICVRASVAASCATSWVPRVGERDTSSSRMSPRRACRPVAVSCAGDAEVVSGRCATMINIPRSRVHQLREETGAVGIAPVPSSTNITSGRTRASRAISS
jgi:hypothetical protein